MTRYFCCIGTSQKDGCVRRAPRHVATAAWLGVVVLLAGCSPMPTPGQGPYPSARSFDGLPQVGALFSGSDAGPHFCTASVVRSPAHNLLITAAHCLEGTGTNVRFVPMYHDGFAPYGTWAVEAAYVSPSWLTSRDPHEDFAFLTVAPHTLHGKKVNVEDVVGGDRLGTTGGFAVRATVVGYPLGTGGRPIECTNGVYDHLGFLAFDCDGYVNGTSGGPWLIDANRATRRGALYGIIGGLHQGGCTPDISYSSYFGAATTATYQRAVHGAPGDIVPAAGSDGC
jgi:V8-like Glu-specific endopeptidase